MARTTAPKTAKTEAQETAVVNTVQEEKKQIVPKDVNMNQYITVRNGFHGTLVYKSERSGELFQWDSFGDEQEMELRELRNAKSTAKGFFINNWFMFDDEFAWVIDYLGMRQYYKHFLSIDSFDEIFDKTPDELRAAVAELSDGQKRSLAYRAYELIASGEIDSLKLIGSLEDSLGIELIEK